MKFSIQSLLLSFLTSFVGVFSAPYVNIALNKPAAQVSTYAHYEASNAVDGVKTNCSFDFSHTDNPINNPWWTVDLQETYSIQSVTITLRPPRGYQGNYKILVGSVPYRTSPGSYHVCVDTNLTSQSNSLTCTQPTRGRYIAVMFVHKTVPLCLCEVEVYAAQDVNRALNKPAFQVSTYAHYVASKAVDGLKSNCGSSFSHTNYPINNPWWTVDLQGILWIRSVTITLRPHTSYQGNYRILVGSAPYTTSLGSFHVFVDTNLTSQSTTLTCAQPTKGRYVAVMFVQKTVPLCLCEVEVYADPVSQACQDTELINGLTHRVSDNQLTASSSYGNGGSHGPARSRLHTKDKDGNSGGWCSRRRITDQWIQVDFQKYLIVSGIATQGRQLRLSEWVTSYYVKYHDGLGWNTVQDGGQTKVFTGNTDRDSVVKQTFRKPIYARYIRLYSKTWHNWICLRWEVYGCTLTECSNLPQISGPGHSVSDCQLSASSQYRSWGALATKSRLNTKGGWCAAENCLDQWIEVDFEQRLLVSAIATQGRYHTSNSYKYYTVHVYQILYSDDGYTWKTYAEEGSTKSFTGSYYSNTVQKNTLTYPFLARYVRLNPRSYYNWICLRWEVYGCRV